MQMDDGLSAGAAVIKGLVQRDFFGRRITGKQTSVRIETRYAAWIKKPQGCVGWCYQAAAVAEPQADVTRGARRQSALEQRQAEPANLATSFVFIHDYTFLCRPYYSKSLKLLDTWILRRLAFFMPRASSPTSRRTILAVPSPT